MVDKVYQQYEAIRRSGKANMLNVDLVQRIAYESDYFELVNAIEEHNKEWYLNFAKRSVNMIDSDDDLDVELPAENITVEVTI